MMRYADPVSDQDWAAALGRLKAPHGVHAVLGNHDWWADRDVQRLRRGTPAASLALQDAGIPVYENRSVRLSKNGQPFWLAGLGDQEAFWASGARRSRRHRYLGADDLLGALGHVSDDAPVILMAHEPDIFPRVPDRVALTVSGHTHGGQVRIFGYAPIVPSSFGNRYVYGHVVEDDRNLIVSAGLGCSGVPVRFGAPPEIVMIELAA
jgi:predicted MPP superfamily phosphohydrolase